MYWQHRRRVQALAKPRQTQYHVSLPLLVVVLLRVLQLLRLPLQQL